MAARPCPPLDHQHRAGHGSQQPRAATPKPARSICSYAMSNATASTPPASRTWASRTCTTSTATRCTSAASTTRPRSQPPDAARAHQDSPTGHERRHHHARYRSSQESDPAAVVRRLAASGRGKRRFPLSWNRLARGPAMARQCVLAQRDVRPDGCGPMTVRSLTARIWAGIQRARLRSARFR
jgi:hypothetical protein